MPTNQERTLDDPYVKFLINERKEIIKRDNLEGMGKIFHANNFELKRNQYKITKARKVALRNIRRNQIRRKGAKPDQWDLFKEFKGKSRPLPGFVTPSSVGKYFNQLSYLSSN